MAKPKVIMPWERPTPTLKTPSLGEKGDMCDRTLENECRIDTILRKYGEIPARPTEDVDFSNIPTDPVDLLAYVRKCRNLLDNAGLGYDGSIVDQAKFDAMFGKKDEVVDEKKGVVPEEVKSHLPKDGE